MQGTTFRHVTDRVCNPRRSLLPSVFLVMSRGVVQTSHVGALAPFPPLPFPSLFLEVAPPLIVARGWGSALALPAGPGRARPSNPNGIG